VLLCEDHPLNQKVAARLLEKAGVSVEIAGNGSIGVDMFSRSPVGYYDAVLMDVRMPVMDGIAATAAIRALAREDAPRVPIIAMTANAYEEDAEKSKAAGMNAHLSKPVDPNILYDTLAEFISARRGASASHA
jgi:CheY-like chemotaxis protein